MSSVSLRLYQLCFLRKVHVKLFLFFVTVDDDDYDYYYYYTIYFKVMSFCRLIAWLHLVHCNCIVFVKEWCYLLVSEYLHALILSYLIPVSEQRDMRYEFGHLLEFLQHLNKVKVRKYFYYKINIIVTFILGLSPQ